MVGLIGLKPVTGHNEFGLFHGILIDEDANWASLCEYTYNMFIKILEDYKDTLEYEYTYVIIKCIPIIKYENKLLSDSDFNILVGDYNI